MMNKNLTIRNLTAEFLIYKSDNQDVKVDVLIHNENIWLTQEQMAQLFGKAKSTINEHIKNIFRDEELIESQVIQKFGNSEFQQKAPNYYNLDTIISVGYRVKSNKEPIIFLCWKIIAHDCRYPHEGTREISLEQYC